LLSQKRYKQKCVKTIKSQEDKQMRSLQNIERTNFSLVELIAVLIIAGILSVIASANISGGDIDLVSESDTLVSNLRFAQSMAMKDDENTWGILFDNEQYELQQNGITQNVASFPNSNSKTYIMIPDITATGSVEFNEWGQPVGGADVAITLTKTGVDTATVTIKSTGEIQ